MVEMGKTAELEVTSAERSGALSGGGMRTIWQLDAGISVAPALDRRVLAASLHRLLEGWRAAERQVAELVDDRENSSPPATSVLLDAIARYRAEYARIFDVIEGLALADEPARFEWSADHDQPAGSAT
jgi:hypothetical protein